MLEGKELSIEDIDALNPEYKKSILRSLDR